MDPEDREKQDRREGYVPVAMIEFVEKRLEKHQAMTADLINKHTENEMERYDQIVAETRKTAGETRTNREHFDARHDNTAREISEVNRSLDTFIDAITQSSIEHSNKISAINTAFIKDDEGNPNHHGHRLGHKEMMESSQEIRKIMRHVFMVVLSAAAVSVSAWVWMSIRTQAIQDVAAGAQVSRTAPR